MIEKTRSGGAGTPTRLGIAVAQRVTDTPFVVTGMAVTEAAPRLRAVVGARERRGSGQGRLHLLTTDGSGGWVEESLLSHPNLLLSAPGWLAGAGSTPLQLLAQADPEASLALGRTLVWQESFGDWEGPYPASEAGHFLGNPVRWEEQVFALVRDWAGNGFWYRMRADLRRWESRPVPSLRKKGVTGQALALTDAGLAWAVVSRQTEALAEADGEALPAEAWLGHAMPPYREWHWQGVGFALRDPQLLWSEEEQALWLAYLRLTTVANAPGAVGAAVTPVLELARLQPGGGGGDRLTLASGTGCGHPALLLRKGGVGCLYHSAPVSGLPGGLYWTEVMDAQQGSSQDLGSWRRMLGGYAGGVAGGLPPAGGGAEEGGAARGSEPGGQPRRWSMGPAKAPNCWQCRHFASSWDETKPYQCRLHGFKSRMIPSWEVWNADGRHCLGFARRES